MNRDSESEHADRDLEMAERDVEPEDCKVLAADLEQGWRVDRVEISKADSDHLTTSIF